MFRGSMEESGNGKFLPFEMGYLTPFYQKKAETELNETPENLEKGLRMMREMVKKDEHFKGLNIDDDFLIQYLRCKKYDIDRAFFKLKSLVEMRKKRAEWFTNIEFRNVSVLTRHSISTFLPYRCPNGCAILLAELDNWDTKCFPIEEVKRCIVLFLIQALRDPMTQVNGFKVIFNVKNVPFRYIQYCTPSNLYLLYHGTQECIPGRFKEIHFVNHSPLVKIAWLVLKNAMSDKFKKRLFFHSGPETLLNYFPKEVLPVKYGGDLEDYYLPDWLRKVTQPEMLASWIFGDPQEDM